MKKIHKIVVSIIGSLSVMTAQTHAATNTNIQRYSLPTALPTAEVQKYRDINRVGTDLTNLQITSKPTPTTILLATPKPTATPTPKPTPKPTAKPTPKLTPKPTSKPTVKSTSKPTPKPTPKSTPKPADGAGFFQTIQTDIGQLFQNLFKK